jgi:nitroimidazol reductase NimA-like FMN-containing flavoprotein (pyridoxamine 5'-phosphate oxidase superfamily)
MKSASVSTTLRRHPERAVPGEVADILLSGIVAHVGIVENGLPVVIPMTYAFDESTPNALYIHGSTDARILAGAERGAPACVTVTEIRGLVFSKTALNHSMVYRSVMGFGHMTEITDETRKAGVLRRMIERYFPGRAEGRDFSAATGAHLAITRLVAIEVEAWSAKARKHGAAGPGDGDDRVPGTSGVVEL